MTRRAVRPRRRPPLRRLGLLLPGLGIFALALLVVVGSGIAPLAATVAEGTVAERLALQGEAGRGALRPYVHIFAAYGIAWVLILFWVWRIARGLKRAQKGG